jgi:hypothetical protein
MCSRMHYRMSQSWLRSDQMSVNVPRSRNSGRMRVLLVRHKIHCKSCSEGSRPADAGRLLGNQLDLECRQKAAPADCLLAFLKYGSDTQEKEVNIGIVYVHLW